jgi:hypothetical protein
MSPIKDVQERYKELGRLRMGEVVEYASGKKGPGRLDTWRLTSPSKTLLEHAAGLWGGEVEVWENAPTEGEQFELTTEVSALAVIVPPQDIDANSWYELWSAGGIKRRCDGETDFISGRSCPCAPKETRECKPTTYLKVMLPEIPDIGTWRLVTRGWNAAAELTQVVRLLSSVAPHTFAEASLRIESRTSKSENAQGKTETHHFIVPVLDLPFSMGDLMRHAPSELTAGRGGRVGLPGDAPALPEAGTVSGDDESEWGAPAALPQGSEPEGMGEGSEGSEQLSSGGDDGGAIGTPITVSLPVEPSEDSASEGGPVSAVSAAPDPADPAPPLDDDLDDEPAADWRWANANALGLDGNKALKKVREMCEKQGLAGPVPTSQSQVTNRQLQAAIEGARK